MLGFKPSCLPLKHKSKYLRSPVQREERPEISVSHCQAGSGGRHCQLSGLTAESSFMVLYHQFQLVKLRVTPTANAKLLSRSRKEDGHH